MKRLTVALAVLVAAAVVSAHVRAQPGCGVQPGCQAESGPPIKVEVGPVDASSSLCTCHEADADINIDVTGWSGSMRIHIYDLASSNVPVRSIGRVRIIGVSAGLTALGVNVSSRFSPWHDDADANLSPGCVHFGGLIVDDPSTRAITRVLAVCSGDLKAVRTDSPPPEVTGGWH